MRKRISIFQNIDWLSVSLYLILMVIGWVCIYAAVYNEDHSSILDMSQNYGKQLLWISGSIVIAIMIMIIDARFFEAFAYGIYGLVILFLIAALFLAKDVKGAHAWIEIGAFKLQPAEFAKFATALALAKYLGQIEIKIRQLKTKIISTLLILIPAVIILLQNDTGSALVFGAFIFVLYREGLSQNVLIISFLAVLLFVVALMVEQIILLGIITGIAALAILLMRKTRKNILTVLAFMVVAGLVVMSVSYVYEKVLQPHQKQRIDVLLGKQTDLKGAGYNVNQSLIAIGSGGLTGKGFLQGTQTRFEFVPEQSTDFIFCTIGEEWGFVGTSILLFIYLGLLYRILFIAERQKSAFTRIYAYGVASVIFLHVMVNIGMTIGLLPVIGIPLPFISYGGSSLWSFTILLFILLRLDSFRTFVFR
ncbi:MAG: rod shape-determining protein RodA [Bacteroidia bacterium]|nr:rod shape-determining protein RodA [Bacteroidia bacterium]MCZ2277910.1 rod shape-determining protein RodA [Bacteroidia bacterium]